MDRVDFCYCTHYGTVLVPVDLVVQP
eukprot:SAG31_NODE_25200_length_466_cov_0.820163_1_plen_25_part_01